MKKENKDFFKDKRWNEYQPVNVLKAKVKLTDEHKKKIKIFEEYIKDGKDKDTSNK